VEKFQAKKKFAGRAREIGELGEHQKIKSIDREEGPLVSAWGSRQKEIGAQSGKKKKTGKIQRLWRKLVVRGHPTRNADQGGGCRGGKTRRRFWVFLRNPGPKGEALAQFFDRRQEDRGEGKSCG